MSSTSYYSLLLISLGAYIKISINLL